MKSLSFCDAFSSSLVFACSLLYDVKKNQPSDGPLPAWPGRSCSRASDLERDVHLARLSAVMNDNVPLKFFL
jgi:hypothetical protein